MREIIVALASICAAACAAGPPPAPSASGPYSMADAEIFPAEASLKRAEDGVILDDGRIVVADQRSGLAAVASDGSVAPFGKFAEAGYAHKQEKPAGPNGVAFTTDRDHILVADIYSGAIWRVSVFDESVEKIWQHEFGVNSAVEGPDGAVWFTQSTENAPGADAEVRMFAAIDKASPDGKVFRLAGGEATPMAQKLAFANGLAIDSKRGRIYYAETMADRIWAADFDKRRPDVLRNVRVIARLVTPDNVKIGRDGVVYVASPLSSSLISIDPDDGATRTYFSAANFDTDGIAAEWRRRVAAGEGVIDLFTPAVWGEMPGAVTSVILDAAGDPAYLGNLGDALVKLDAPRE